MDSLKKYEIIKFEPWHLKMLTLRTEDGNPDLDYLGNIFFRGGPAYTCVNKENILFCAGIVLIMPGVGEAWSYCDVSVKKHPFDVLHYQKKYLLKEMDRLELHRVQAHCLTSWKTAYKYLEKIGFQREGLIRKYDPEGRNYYLYSLIKE
jgi:hypothetical protein